MLNGYFRVWANNELSCATYRVTSLGHQRMKLFFVKPVKNIKNMNANLQTIKKSVLQILNLTV